jgi:photosystem II stability/assembly factor-like uncharacterized protein
MANKKHKTHRSYSKNGLILTVALLLFGGFAIWGVISQATNKSIDELKVGSAAHPHVFSYAPDGKTVWLGTHLGVYQWLDQKWTRSVEPLGKNDVMNIEIDHLNTNTIYTSGHGFIKKSEDGGSTWKSIETGMPNQPKPDVPDAHLLTMDSKDSKHLYTMIAGKTNTMYESKDGGASWSKLGAPTSSPYSIAAAPDNGNSIIAGTEQGLFRYDLINGTLKETKIGNDPAFQLTVLSNGDVIAMGEGGFTRSSDLKTWVPFKVDLNGEMPLGIKASKTDPNRLVIVTQKLRLIESHDGGKSWLVAK